MNELKQCPFCGGKAIVCISNGNATVWTANLEAKNKNEKTFTHYFVMCGKCHVRTQPYLTTRGMWNAWNRRAVTA